MQDKYGFTLVELIIIIVILGVLTVVAAPTFVDVSTDARIAKLGSLEGSMRTASELVNYKARIEDKTDCSTDPTVEVSGEDITLRCGYPCPHPSGIEAAVEADDGFTWIGGNCAGLLGYIEVQVTDATDPSNCKIRYAAARAEDTPPTFTATTDGC